MEMLMNDKRRSGNSGSFADIGDLDKLESELNEIKGTKVLVRRALVLKCCLVFQICLAQQQTKEVNTKSDSNVGTATSDIIGGKSSTWDGIDVPTKFGYQRFYKLRRPRKKA
jgi:hypothetical protein